MKHTQNEKGAILVLVPVVLFIFLAMAALVIDVGNIYFKKQTLQKAVDAAALAGAPEIIKPSGDVDGFVSSYLNKNMKIEDYNALQPTGINGTKLYLTDNTNKKLTVSAKVPVTLFFGSFVGYSTVIVSADAVVQLKTLTSARAVLPFGIDDKYACGIQGDIINDRFLLLEDSPSHNGSTSINTCGSDKILPQTNGNIGYLNFNPINPGGGNAALVQDFNNYIEHMQGKRPLSDLRLVNFVDTYHSKPGKNNSSGIRTALNKLKGAVVLVPIYSSSGNGVLDIKIKGFVSVKLDDFNVGNEIWGTVISNIEKDGDTIPPNGTTPPNYGTYVMKLVK